MVPAANSPPRDHFPIADYQTQRGIPFFSRGRPCAGMEARRFMNQVCETQLRIAGVVETTSKLANA